MNKQQITDRVIEIIADISNKIISITPESDLRKDLRMDAVDIVALCIRLEAQFGIKGLILGCAHEFHTVQDVINTIIKLTGNDKKST